MEPGAGQTMLKDSPITPGKSLPDLEKHGPEAIDQALADGRVQVPKELWWHNLGQKT